MLDNGTPLNSRFASVPPGYAGANSDNGAALVAEAGAFNLDAALTVASLYSALKLQSYSSAVRHRFGDHIEGFLDLGFDRTLAKDTSANSSFVNIQAGDPANPFQQNVSVRIVLPNLPRISERELKSYRVRGGMIVRLARHWSASIEHSWSKNVNSFNFGEQLNLSTALPYLSSIALRDLNIFPADPVSGGAEHVVNVQGPFKDELNDTILNLSGPLVRLPAGPLKLTSYVEQRKEDIAASVGGSPSETSSAMPVQLVLSATSAARSNRRSVSSPSAETTAITRLPLRRWR